MTTFVLVPGACHGGWWYRPLVERLTALGHRAEAVTLAGLDPDGPETDGSITLDTHVAQLVDLLDAGPDDAVLVGHSYAGCVLSGAADRVPERIRTLVYIDAFVPEDGDSCWSMTTDEQRDWYIGGAGRTGVGVAPLPFFDARAMPHPLAAFVQRSRLTGAWTSVRDKHYVAAMDPGWAAQSPFVPTARRLHADPAWTVHDLPVTHNVLAGGPDALLAILLPLA